MTHHKEILRLAINRGEISANDVVNCIPNFLSQNIASKDSGTKEAYCILKELEGWGVMERQSPESGFEQIFVPVVGLKEGEERIGHADDAIVTSRSKSKKREPEPVLGKYLRKKILDYSIFVIGLQGNVGVTPLLEEAAAGYEGCDLTLLLGPTSPSSISQHGGVKVGWVTSANEGQNCRILSPNNLSDLDIYLSDIMGDRKKKHVFIGDFLDNILPQHSLETLFSYYSSLINRLRVNKCTAIFLLQEDLHDSHRVSTIKRYADVIIDLHQREVKDRTLFQVRISNFVDGIYSDWIPYRGLLGL